MRFAFSVLLGSALLFSQSSGKQIPLDTFPMSSAMSPDGKFLLVLHAGLNQPSVQVLNAKTLEKVSSIGVTDAWLGLKFSPNGKNVYVGGGSSGSIFEFTLSEEGQLRPARTFEVVPAAQRQSQDFIGDVTPSPDGRLLYAAILHRNLIAVINPLSGMVIEKIQTARRPYRILFHPDGQSFFVSSWADSAVVHHRAETGERLNVFRVGPHPTDMIWRTKPPELLEDEVVDWKSRLFVASANTNNVYVLGFKEDKTARLIETINISRIPNQPLGMTPSAFALSADQNLLYTVCSDANAVAVSDVSMSKATMQGFLATGEYPTSAYVLSDGRVFVLNGAGSASVVSSDEISTDHGVLPLPPDGRTKSAIEHVIYVVSEGSSGSSFSRLAKDYVSFDHFHANGSTISDKVSWAMSAITPDYVRKLSPGTVAGRRKISDYEGDEPASLAPAGTIAANAIAKGLSVRSFALGANLAELDYVKLPQLVTVRLRNGDDALGKIAEAASKSSQWKSTAIFFIDVSSRKAIIVSPYARRQGVNSSHYDTSSVLRTIELILGLSPMTYFDAAAQPMSEAFSSTPNLALFASTP